MCVCVFDEGRVYVCAGVRVCVGVGEMECVLNGVDVMLLRSCVGVVN